MKRHSFRASRGRGETRIKNRERYNGSSSISNSLMKCQGFRASRGRGKLNSDKNTIQRIVFFF